MTRTTKVLSLRQYVAFTLMAVLVLSVVESGRTPNGLLVGQGQRDPKVGRRSLPAGLRRGNAGSTTRKVCHERR
jgi:hypothetical protein